MSVNQISIKTNPNKHFKERVNKIRHLLPENIRQIVMERHPEFNTMDGYVLFTNVLYGRSADIRLTEILEEIAGEYQADKKEASVNS